MSRAVLLVAALLLSVFPAPTLAAAEEPYVLEDPAGDGAYSVTSFSGDEPLARSPIQQPTHTDVRRLEILAETAVNINLQVTVQDLRGNPAKISECYTPSSDRRADEVQIHFSVARQSLAVWTSMAGQWDLPGTTFEATHVAACLGTCLSTYCYGRPIPFEWDGARDQIRFMVPKERVHRLAERPEESPLGKGTPLTDIHVVSFAHSFPRLPLIYDTVRIHDRMPNAGSGPEYAMQRSTANTVLKAALEMSPILPVEVGRNQSVSFTMENKASQRRLLAFEFELIGSPERVGAYQVWGPRSATLPPGERRTFHFALDVGPAATPGDNVTLAITATSPGFPEDVGYAEARIVPSPALGPGLDTLFLHVPTKRGGNCDLPRQTHSLLGQNCHAGSPFLSTFEDDPTVPSEGIAYLRPSSGIGYPPRASLWVDMVGWSPTPLLLNKSRPMRFTLTTVSQDAWPEVEVQVEIGRFNASHETPLPLGRATRTLEISPGGHTTSIDVPIRTVEPLLARGTAIHLKVSVTVPSGANAAVAATLDTFGIRPVDTRLRLPFDELPEELRTRLATSPIQVSALGFREDFVNPGRRQAFNITLFNQAAEPFTARLAAAMDRPGWEAELRPGQEFRLGPGEMIRVLALARAPANAGEGERARLLVSVTDGQGNVQELPFVLTVTTSVDLVDAEAHAKVDSDAVERLQTPPRTKTPGPGVLLVVLAVLAAAFANRARRPKD